MERTLGDWQTTVNQWVDQTFGPPQTAAVLTHLHEEISELKEEVYGERRRSVVGDELADCFHLLFRLATLAGVNMDEAMERKFAENVSRTWGPRDARGVIRHVDSTRVHTAPVPELELEDRA